jgi:hypothetical protein
MFCILLIAPLSQSTGPGGAWSQRALVPGLPGDAFGYSLAVGPDYDGDGWPEYLVGAPDRQGAGDVGGVTLVHGGDGAPLWHFVSPYPIQIAGSVGSSVAFIPDLNGDGYADLITGDPSDMEVIFGGGRAYVLDGLTGTIIREHIGAVSVYPSGDETGSAVLGIPDVDGDGAGDYLVSAPKSDLGIPGAPPHGKVTLYSGSSGTVLWSLTRDRHLSQGLALAVGPDLSSDGHQEVLVSAYTWADPGGVHYVDPTTGLVLQTIPAVASQNGTGAEVGAIAATDLDGDGLEDLIVGSYYAASSGGIFSGMAAAFSSVTRQMLWRVDSLTPDEWFGYAVGTADDLDLDGYPEVLVGVPTDWQFHATGKGYVQVLSGRDGSPLWKFRTTTQSYTHYGHSLSAYGRDGRQDMALVGEFGRYAIQWDGAVHVVEFEPFLAADTRTLSASAGGLVRWILEFPSSEAGLPYALLASASGRGPTLLGGIEVPLTQDGVLARTIAGQYPAGFQQARGVLDSQGRAQAVLMVQPGVLAGQVGRTYYLAAVTGQGGQGSSTSIAVPLRIVP